MAWQEGAVKDMVKGEREQGLFYLGSHCSNGVLSTGWWLGYSWCCCGTSWCGECDRWGVEGVSGVSQDGMATSLGSRGP